MNMYSGLTRPATPSESTTSRGGDCRHRDGDVYSPHLIGVKPVASARSRLRPLRLKLIGQSHGSKGLRGRSYWAIEPQTTPSLFQVRLDVNQSLFSLQRAEEGSQILEIQHQVGDGFSAFLPFSFHNTWSHKQHTCSVCFYKPSVVI